MRLRGPIEEKLHVIMVMSNACMYKRRYQLAHEFIARMETTGDVILYIVELAYGDQPYELTDAGNPRHLQLRAPIPLWHKENMINLGVRMLLPKNWRAFAWIDADLTFENKNWAMHTLKLLNSEADIVQLMDTAVLLDASNRPQTSTIGVAHSNKKRERNLYAHPGFAWAMTRQMYERLGGLFEYAILGGADCIMSVLSGCHGDLLFTNDISDVFVDMLLKFREKARNVRLGYVPGRIIHSYHGSFENRNYMNRWGILIKHKYNPRTFLTKNAQGVLIPTPECPRQLLRDIMQYFWERNEDEDTFPVSPREPCPNYLQSWEREDTAEEP